MRCRRAVAGSKVIVAASSAAMVDYVRNQFTFYVLEGLNERARALGVEIVTRPIADRREEIGVLEEARDDARGRRLSVPDASTTRTC